MWDQGPVSRMFLIPMWHPVLIADLTPEWTPLSELANNGRYTTIGYRRSSEHRAWWRHPFDTRAEPPRSDFWTLARTRPQPLITITLLLRCGLAPGGATGCGALARRADTLIGIMWVPEGRG